MIEAGQDTRGRPAPEQKQPLLAPFAGDDVVIDVQLEDRPICPAHGTPVRRQRRRRSRHRLAQAWWSWGSGECSFDVVTGEMPAVSRAIARADSPLHFGT